MDTPEFLTARRDAVCDAWGLTDEIVLVRNGDLVGIPGTDMEYPFYPHPEHRYLADCDIPGAVLTFDAVTGGWELFTPRHDVDAKIWHAVGEELGRPVSELDDWLAERSGRPVRQLGASVTEATDPLRIALDELRTRKDAAELGRMRAAAATTVAGFAELVDALQPGRTEHQLGAVIDSGFLRAGAEKTSYPSIVASGNNASVLHFAPSRRVVEEGDFVLVDAAGMVDGYASDCTRTWVVGTPTEMHEAIWTAVLDAQAHAVERCVPGQEYKQLHIDCATDMARSMIDLGLLRGEVHDLVARGAMALLFPHGLGHLVGLAVHDAGGYAPGRERSPAFGLRYLRTDRPLEAGMVVTIEPGIYFIEPLLTDPEVRQRHRDDIDWSMIDELIGIGGVRIEDCVHVTDYGPEPLTIDVPKMLSVPV